MRHDLAMRALPAPARLCDSVGAGNPHRFSNTCRSAFQRNLTKRNSCASTFSQRVRALMTDTANEIATGIRGPEGAVEVDATRALSF